jgi:uncharacterized Fe-S cluster-containing radical SAM superfamily protein
MSYIDTEAFSLTLRNKAIDFERKSILLTNFNGSEQEKDLTEPANCKGFGRVRHFKLGLGKDWPQNPLPILPAAKALGLKPESEIRAQVFQNSICNWRCWYCFVDFKLLNGDKQFSSPLTCDQMLDLYLDQANPPPMLDLTGGQPDLTPEWIPWMMESILQRGLEKRIYIWSDDNLSNDYLWRYLSDAQLQLIADYKMYARVCCFKGIDEESFSLNTKADPQLFKNQFSLCRKLIDLGIDLYCYLTLPAGTATDFSSTIPKFIDDLQAVQEMLPLRIVPLKISEFTPTKTRVKEIEQDLMKGQYTAIQVWIKELERRFSPEQLKLPITEVPIR